MLDLSIYLFNNLDTKCITQHCFCLIRRSSLPCEQVQDLAVSMSIQLKTLILYPENYLKSVLLGNEPLKEEFMRL